MDVTNLCMSAMNPIFAATSMQLSLYLGGASSRDEAKSSGVGIVAH